MPDDYHLVPVDHDPFGFTPVDHDPFADMPGMITRPSGAQQWESAIQEQRQRQMWDALKPSTGEQIGTGIAHYIHGGVPEVLQQQFGFQLPDWVNASNEFLHRGDVNAALGVMTPMKGAGMVPGMEQFPVRLKSGVSPEMAAGNLAKAQEFKQKVEALGPQYEVRLDPDSGGSVYANILRRPLKKDGTPSAAGNPKNAYFKARFSDHGSYWGNNISVDPHSGNSVDQAVNVAHYHLTGEGEPPIFGDAKIDPSTGEHTSYQVQYNRNAAMNASNPKYPVKPSPPFPDPNSAPAGIGPASKTEPMLRPGTELGRTGPPELQPMAREAAPSGITAYHGSPHDFDRFDLSKIGTGEGAQAFGHGLYFAENEGVARSYQNVGKDVRNLPVEEMEANSALRFMKGDREKALAWLEQKGRRAAGESMEPIYTKAADLLRSGWKRGSMYQVSINADPEHFLDWDKPLSEQSEHVKKVFGELGHDEGATGEQAYRAFVDRSDASKKERMAANQAEVKAGRMTPKEANQLNQKIWNEPDQLHITDRLRSAGIPGIKYLDQGSRGSADVDVEIARYNHLIDLHKDYSAHPDSARIIKDAQAKIADLEREKVNQTRNYVLFDDKLIDILKKYGIAGIGALPAMGAYHLQTHQVDHDPFAR